MGVSKFSRGSKEDAISTQGQTTRKAVGIPKRVGRPGVSSGKKLRPSQFCGSEDLRLCADLNQLKNSQLTQANQVTASSYLPNAPRPPSPTRIVLSFSTSTISPTCTRPPLPPPSCPTPSGRAHCSPVHRPALGARHLRTCPPIISVYLVVIGFIAYYEQMISWRCSACRECTTCGGVKVVVGTT